VLRAVSGGTIDLQFGYDALGNRISASRSGAVTKYIIDPSGSMANVIAETNSAGAITAYYIHGIGLIARIDALTNEARYYHYDRTGNTVALTDSSGAVTDQYAYDLDPFAFNVTKFGDTMNPFTFVGQFGVMDEGDNLYFMRARYYDAAEGKFLNEDPIGFEGGDLNLYAYVGSEPIAGIDREGLQNTTSKDQRNAIRILNQWHLLTEQLYAEQEYYLANALYDFLECAVKSTEGVAKMFLLKDVKETIDVIGRCSSSIAKHSGHENTATLIENLTDLYALYDSLNSIKEGMKAANKISKTNKGVNGIRSNFSKILKSNAYSRVGQRYFKAITFPSKIIGFFAH
jgi:RHS repeat-associated protein